MHLRLLIAKMMEALKFYIFYLIIKKKWAKGNSIEEINANLIRIFDPGKFGIDVYQCIDNKKVEDHILEDRIEAVRKFKLNATPTLIINNKKFEKPLNYKNIKKTLEKLI